MIELLISIGMVAILAVSTASIATFSRDSATQTQSLTTVLSLRSLMLSTIENPAAWTATLNNDSSLACIKNQSSCESGAKQLKLYDETGSVFYDGSSSQKGFTTTGKPCDSYSTDTTTDCVYHYQLTWEPICQSDGSKVCSDPNPLVRVSAQLQIASTKNRSSSISSDSYSLAVIKGFATNSMEKNCIAVSGVFNPNTKTCSAAVAMSRRCPAGTVVTSVQADGSLTCGSPFVETCAATDVLVGRKTDGSPICENKIARIPASVPPVLTPPVPPNANCKVGDGFKNHGDTWESYGKSVITYTDNFSFAHVTTPIVHYGFICNNGVVEKTNGGAALPVVCGPILTPPCTYGSLSLGAVSPLACTGGQEGQQKDFSAGNIRMADTCSDGSYTVNLFAVTIKHSCVYDGVTRTYRFIPMNFNSGGVVTTLIPGALPTVGSRNGGLVDCIP